MDTQIPETQPRSFYPDYAPEKVPNHGRPGWNLKVERRLDDGRTLARQLGWFSIGLGVTELLAAERVTDWLGVDDDYAPLVRFYGLREIASGVGILSERTPTSGVMSRVAGDALDLATLGLSFSRNSTRPGRVFAAMALVAGAAALDLICTKQLSATARGGADV